MALLKNITSGSVNGIQITGSLDVSNIGNFAGGLTTTGSLNVSGSLNVDGTITATTLVVQTITSSTDYVTGSTRFGSLLSDTHQFTGSVSMTGSLVIKDTLNVATSATVNNIKISVGLGNVSNNIGIGSSSLSATTVGQFNIAIGEIAGAALTSANWNTLVGYNAGNALTTGTQNAFFGHNSGRLLTTFNYNTFYGQNAGRDIATGSENTFVGQSAGFGFISGTGNVIVGRGAAGSNRTGDYNIHFGYNVGINNTGIQNIFIGKNTGISVTSGSYNVIVGANNGSTISTLSNFILFSDGEGNERFRIPSTGNFLINTTTDTGYKFYVSGSGTSGSLNIDNTLHVNSSRNVLIGTTTDAGYKLDVNGTARATTFYSDTYRTSGSAGGSTMTFYAGPNIRATLTDGGGGVFNVNGSITTTGGQMAPGTRLLLGGGAYIQSNYQDAVLYRYGPNNSTFATLVLDDADGTSVTNYKIQRWKTGGVEKATLDRDGNLWLSGSGAISNGLTVTGSVIATSFTGSLSGSATSALTASYVTTLNQDVQITGSLIVSSSNATQLLVGTNTLFVSGSGNVGIGTTTPDASRVLDVNGQSLFRDVPMVFRTGNTPSYMQIVNQSAGTSAEVYLNTKSNSGDFNFGKYSTTKTAYKFISSSDGYIYNTSADIAILNDAATGNIKFAAGASSAAQMTLTSAGRLLIGTTTESTYELDVVGDIRSTLDANINGLTVGKGGANSSGNTAIGVDTLLNNTTGIVHTAVGFEAMRANTGGVGNVAVGRWAMRNNASITLSTAVGAGAMYNTTNTLSGVTAIGVDAGQSSSTSNVVYLGSEAGKSNGGTQSTIIGFQAVSQAATSGPYNTITGFRSGYVLTSGAGNVLYGYQQGYELTTGAYNTFIGSSVGGGAAGNGITTGSYNTIIGSQITGLSASLSNTIILADGQGNQRLYIDNNGNAAIGTSTLVSKTGRWLQITATSNVESSLVLNRTGGVSDARWDLFIPASSNALRLYNSNAGDIATFTNSGRLLLGTTTESTYLLDVTGTARISSSLTVQENIVSNIGGLAITRTLTGIMTLSGSNNIVIGNGAAGKASDSNFQGISRSVIIGDSAARSDNNGSSSSNLVVIGYRALPTINAVTNDANVVIIGTDFNYNSGSIAQLSNFVGWTGVGAKGVIAYGNNYTSVFGTEARAWNQGGAGQEGSTLFSGYSYLTVIGARATGSDNNAVVLGRTLDDTLIGRINKVTGSYKLQVEGNQYLSGTLNVGATGSTSYKVNVVGSGNFTNGLTVTGSLNISSGSVTMPNRPAFRVTGTSSSDITATTTISGSAVSVDYNQGNYYTASSGVFTAPIAGLYSVYMNLRCGSINAQQQAIMYKNNTTSSLMWEAPGNTGVAHFGVSGILNLAANDTLKVVVTVGSIQFDGNDSYGAAYIG